MRRRRLILTAQFGSGYQFTTGSEGLAGVTRTFDSFEEAAAEAGESRVFGGIHYRFDNVVGLEAGAELGKYVLTNVLLPRDDGDDLLTAAAPAPALVNVTLSADQVQPLLAEALARWRAAGVDTSALRGVEVRIADLGGLTLAQSRRRDHLAGRRRGRVGLVRRCDAVGRFRVRRARRSGRSRDGWTCSRHSSTRSATCSVTTTTRAGVMQETLTAGTRRTVGPAVADDVHIGGFMLFGADEDFGDPSISLPGRNGKRK